MKKKIIGALIAAALIGVALFQVVPAMADTQVMDHVQLAPASATLAVGGTQQFTAQAYDASNAAISSGVSYFWMTVASGGAIGSTTGLFTAGSTPGTYTNTVQVVAVQGGITKIANATIIVTGTAGPLDHVTITPASTTLAPGDKRHFEAQAYDASNIAISGLTYTWSVVAGGGTIDATTGLFTAGATPGTYANTVQVSTTQTVTKTATASVTVSTETQAPTPTPNMDIAKLTRMFTGYLNSVGFDNFLGGQWQVKNGTSTDTVKVIPGIVQTVSATSLTIMVNGQTAPGTFTLTADTAITPKNTQLAATDKVIVVTVNDQVKLVVKVTAPTTDQLPPGQKEQEEDKHEGNQTPANGSHGNNAGGSNNATNHAAESESESD